MSGYYFHVDLDAFFASVEQKDHPEYKGKPLIVGGLPGDRRAVVSTASYEARKFGVHSAMPIFKAYKLCPDGIFIRGNYGHYSEVSKEIMSIFKNYSPDVLQMSIDEAFINIAGTEHLFGNPIEAAKKLKAEVYEKTGLTVSIGISTSMYVAKIASGYNKPNGLTFIMDGEEEKFMLSLPMDKLWGCGTKTQERLKNAGFRTMQDIYKCSEGLLKSIFGEHTGNYIYNAVRGNKEMLFGTEAENHSISTETTFEFDLTDLYTIETKLMELCGIIMWRMRNENLRSKNVFIKIRYEDWTTITSQETFQSYVTNSDDLFEKCRSLFKKRYEDGKGIRLLGIGCGKTENASDYIQGELFETKNSRKEKLEKAIFSMEKKHPDFKIQKARFIEKTDY